MAAGAAAVALQASAYANGRFPAAFQLIEDPADPGHILVQVTYGLMSTRDAGASWGWACERSIGYIGEVDPPIAFTEGGVAFAALFDGVVRSSPDGCDWNVIEGETEGRYAVDVSTRKDDPRDVVVLTSDGIDNNVFDTRVFRSHDAGSSFARIDAGFPESFVALTIDVAPSDPDRVYVSGLVALGSGEYQGVVGRSDDGGVTYELVPIEGSRSDSAPYLAAVDPNDPDVIYVRFAGQAGTLLRSADGGASFETIFDREGSLLGVALSPDGTTLLVGGDTIPLHRASTSTLIFEPIGDILPRCLTWTDSGIYACGSETVERFTIGISRDRGATFEKLYSRLCTEGPLDCPADTSIGATCDAEWVQTRRNIGADSCPSGAVSSSGSAVASTGGDEGAAGGSGDEETTRGCCAVTGRHGHERPAVVAFVVAMAAWSARRRVRNRGHRPSAGS